MQATAKMTKAGQISIPIEIRKILELEGGDYVTVEVIGKQKIGEKQGNLNESPCLA